MSILKLNEEQLLTLAKDLKEFEKDFVVTTTEDEVVYVSGGLHDQKTSACLVTATDGTKTRVTVTDGPYLNNFFVPVDEYIQKQWDNRKEQAYHARSLGEYIDNKKTTGEGEKMEAYMRQMRKEEMERNGCLNTKQPKPTPSSSPYMWDLVLPDILERDHLGKEKHGTRLQAFNGRDVLKDAYQEALDTVVYLRQAIYERDGK